MKRIRIAKPKAQSEHLDREILPLDPRDPDIVRAKQRARANSAHRQVTRK